MWTRMLLARYGKLTCGRYGPVDQYGGKEWMEKKKTYMHNLIVSLSAHLPQGGVDDTVPVAAEVQPPPPHLPYCRNNIVCQGAKL